MHGNPCPLALGQAGMSSRDALTRKGGKLVEVLQAYGDCLWETLGQRKVPNDGFLPHAVVPVGLGSAGLDSSGYQGEQLRKQEDAHAVGAAITAMHMQRHSLIQRFRKVRIYMQLVCPVFALPPYPLQRTRTVSRYSHQTPSTATRQ